MSLEPRKKEDTVTTRDPKEIQLYILFLKGNVDGKNFLETYTNVSAVSGRRVSENFAKENEMPIPSEVKMPKVCKEFLNVLSEEFIPGMREYIDILESNKVDRLTIALNLTRIGLDFTKSNYPELYQSIQAKFPQALLAPKTDLSYYQPILTPTFPTTATLLQHKKVADNFFSSIDKFYDVAFLDKIGGSAYVAPESAQIMSKDHKPENSFGSIGNESALKKGPEKGGWALPATMLDYIAAEMEKKDMMEIDKQKHPAHAVFPKLPETGATIKQKEATSPYSLVSVLQRNALDSSLSSPASPSTSKTAPVSSGSTDTSLGHSSSSSLSLSNKKSSTRSPQSRTKQPKKTSRVSAPSPAEKKQPNLVFLPDAYKTRKEPK